MAKKKKKKKKCILKKLWRSVLSKLEVKLGAEFPILVGIMGPPGRGQCPTTREEAQGQQGNYVAGFLLTGSLDRKEMPAC